MAVTTTALSAGTGSARTSPAFVKGSAKELWFGTLAMDDSYPTNGEAWDANAQSGLRSVDAVFIQTMGGYTFEYVPSATAASRKIKVYWVDTTVDGAAMAEVANETDISALTAVPVMVVGSR